MIKTNTIERVCAVNAKHVSIDKGIPKFPFDIVIGNWYFNKCFVKDLLITIRKLKDFGLGSKEISQLFKNPTRMSNYLHFVKCPFDNLISEERVELIEDLVEYLAYYRRNDPLCETGKNIIWTSDQLSEIEKHMIEPDSGVREPLGRVIAFYFLYTEMLWGANHGLGHEFHGPYSLGEEEMLFVFSYYDLKPTELFPAASKLPFSEIEVGRVLIDSKSEFNNTWFDMFGHTFFRAGFLQRYYIKIDGKQVTNEADIQMAIDSCASATIEDSKITEIFGEKDFIKRWIELYYYSLKPHKEVLGEDWRPSEEVYAFLEQESDMEEVAAFGEMWMRVWGHEKQEERFELFKDIFLQNIYR